MKKVIHITFYISIFLLLFVVQSKGQDWKAINARTEFYVSKNQIDSALIYAHLELAEAEKESGKVSAKYCYSLLDLGGLYDIKKDYPNAERYYIELTTAAGNYFGAESLAYAQTLDRLGMLYYRLAKYKNAIPLYERKLAIHKKNGIDSSYAECADKLGVIYTLSGYYKNADTVFSRALFIQKVLFGQNSHIYETTKFHIGVLYLSDGSYNDAVTTFNEVLSASKQPGNADLYIGVFENLASAYEALGEFSLAEPRLLEGTELIRTSGGSDSPEYAMVLSNLGNLYLEKGDFHQSESYNLRALSLRSRILPHDHIDYLTSVLNIGELYRQMGNYHQAAKFLGEAFSGVSKYYGKNDRLYVDCLNDIAQLYADIGQFEDAERVNKEIISIREAATGQDNSLFAQALFGLGVLYSDMKKYQPAKDYLLKSAAILEKISATNSVLYQKNLNSLGEVYSKSGDYVNAESYFNQALEISKRNFGTQTLEYAQCLSNVALMYNDLGDYTKAEPKFLQANQIFLYLINRNFGFLSEKEKIYYLNAQYGVFAAYQTFCRNYYATKPDIAGQSYDAELTTKGMVLSTDIQVQKDVLLKKDAEEFSTFEQLRDLKEKLSKQYTLPTGNHTMNVDSLENLANGKEKELIEKSTAFRKGKSLIQTDWKTIKEHLKPDDAAIEFARFRLYKTKRWTDTFLYVALILRTDLPFPIMVDLCSQGQLDSILIKEGNTQKAFINNLYRIRSNGTQSGSTGLYDLLWKPLETHLGKIKHIYFAPTGSMYKISMAALPLSDGSFLSDHFELSQVNSTAMILDPEVKLGGSNLDLAAFGAIDYATPIADLPVEPGIDTLKNYPPMIPGTIDRGGKGFESLPGSLTEINSIDSLANSYRVKVTNYTGNGATEENFKKFRGETSPAIIHISTHGFFFPDPVQNKDFYEQSLDGEALQLSLSDNPLNRSGLIFAGGARSWKGDPVPTGREDGILTAYEVANIPLANTRLVVLSACETGLGEINGNEGVFGLQRGFRASGVSYLLMSLWKVPDGETAEFMKEFYAYLFSCQLPEKAFLAAQTTMKNKYRDEPYKWAGFVLIR